MLSKEKQKESAPGVTCSFRHDSHKRGASTRSSSPAPRSQTNSDGKSSSKGRPPGGSSPSGERLQKPCRDSLKCNRTNRACNLCHPSVKITNHSQAACLAKSVPCYAVKRTDRRIKQGRRKRKCRNCSDCEAIMMCISRCGAAEIQIEFAEGHQFIETKTRCTFNVSSSTVRQ